MAFQNPAQKIAEQRLSLGEQVSLSPNSTFLARSDTNNPEIGIMQGSVHAIDGTRLNAGRVQDRERYGAAGSGRGTVTPQ